MTIASLVAAFLLSSNASADVGAQYDECVKQSHSDADSDRCLDKSSVEIEKALADTVRKLIEVLNASPENKPKAKMLEDAHGKWLPSRDADCKLQAEVTMDSPEDVAGAKKLCVFQANLPRLNQYSRFLGFLKP